MYAYGWLAIGLALGLGSGQVASTFADEVPGAAGVVARIDDGRLTVRPQGAPLAEVLHAIGAAGGFEVILRGPLTEPVDEDIAGVPLEEAIRALVGSHGLMVLRAVPSADQAQGDIAEIRVRAPGGATAQDLAPSDPGQAAQEDVPRQEEIDPAERQEAYRQAVRDYVPPNREELTLALSAPATEDRIVAVPKVGMLPPGEAVAVLEDALAEDQDALVRSRAVAALTRLEGPAAGRLLRQRALEDGDAELRAQAINALATSRGERSVTCWSGRCGGTPIRRSVGWRSRRSVGSAATGPGAPWNARPAMSIPRSAAPPSRRSPPRHTLVTETDAGARVARPVH